MNPESEASKSAVDELVLDEPQKLARKKGGKLHKQTLFIIGMLSVAFINLAIFWVYVNISSILMAFESPADGSFTLINFEQVFREFGRSDSLLPGALLNTIKFWGAGFFIITPLSLLFSFFVYKKIWGYKIFRIIFFMPSIISAVVLTSLFSFMVGVDGPITKAFMWIAGLERTPILLGESRYALNTIILYNIWTGFGTNIILFNGAMSRIPEEIIEYDKLEGVGYFRELIFIVLPLIWPTLSTILIFSIVGIFNASGPILLFTQGNYDTYTISYYIFENVSKNVRMEYSSAIGLVFTVIGVPIALGAKKLLEVIGSDIEY